jgi:hypothetical protein
MTLSPSLRKLALTAHVTSSVGWLGEVAGFLALAIAGATSQDTQIVRSAYGSMDLIYWDVVIPFGLASLLTGFVSSLGTEWGLVRHYWVLVKLLMTIPLTLLMLVHTQPVAYLAGVVANRNLTGTDLRGLRFQLAAYGGAALLALIVATVLSVYKPRGRTGYGQPRSTA